MSDSILQTYSKRLALIIIDQARAGGDSAAASQAIEYALGQVNPELPGKVYARYQQLLPARANPTLALRDAIAEVIQAKMLAYRPGLSGDTDWAGIIGQGTQLALGITDRVMEQRNAAAQRQLDAQLAQRQAEQAARDHELAMQRAKAEAAQAEAARLAQERGQQQAASAYAAGQDGQAPADNTTLYIALGVGGVLLLGGVLFMASKK